MGRNSKTSVRQKDKSRSDSAAGEGPRRIVLLRHGQSEQNLTGLDIPDSPLSDDGLIQAKSWSGKIGALGAEVVLVSPLRRAVQTALLAFEGEAMPLEMCRPARELWWHERCNQPGSEADMDALLRSLPRGKEVQGVGEALCPDPDLDAPTEDESIKQLKEILWHRPEEIVAVVCHWGVINALCQASAGNCCVLVCEYTRGGNLKVVQQQQPPGGPRTC
eukprot:TRINITY_DN100620_c0_g1_i1.p1 TRINITY_DN100620_c0_g1~~TRINITY_DN100620_c0_g1_i1.p1  ORF type:complete len:219 (-),score=30.28 TRINITY_DN100620_c0_g1_i1:129-785(-)